MTSRVTARSPLNLLLPSHNRGCSASDMLAFMPSTATEASKPRRASAVVNRWVSLLAGSTDLVAGRQRLSKRREARVMGSRASPLTPFMPPLLNISARSLIIPKVSAVIGIFFNWFASSLSWCTSFISSCLVGAGGLLVWRPKTPILNAKSCISTFSCNTLDRNMALGSCW